MPRPDGRTNQQLRPLVLERRANPYAEGSCLIRMGGTLVHCTASVETGVPPFKKGSGEGWVTAEYAMLPRATHTRSGRESVKGKVGGRTHEISRLVGRSLRAAIAGSGQNDAADAVGQATAAALHGTATGPVTETGRVNAVVCPGGFSAGSCVASTDPRGSGLATRSD